MVKLTQLYTIYFNFSVRQQVRMYIFTAEDKLIYDGFSEMQRTMVISQQ